MGFSFSFYDAAGFSDIAGQSRLASVSLDLIPFLPISGEYSGAAIMTTSDDPVGMANTMTVGLSLLPVSVGVVACDTELAISGEPAGVVDPGQHGFEVCGQSCVYVCVCVCVCFVCVCVCVCV